MRGPKRSDRRPDELILAAEWEYGGPAQAFLKAGTRNAMVIAVSSCALVLDRKRRRVGVGLGSVGPVVLRARSGSERDSVQVDDHPAGHDERAHAGGQVEPRKVAHLARQPQPSAESGAHQCLLSGARPLLFSASVNCCVS